MKTPFVFDLHCDTVLHMYLENKTLNSCDGHINLAKLKKIGHGVQSFALFLPTYDSAERYGISLAPYELFNAMDSVFLREMRDNAESIKQVRCSKDIEDNIKYGKISALLTLEDCVLLDGKVERVDELFEKGVRIAALTWNYENCVGFPNSFDENEHKKGLKPFGFDALERMNELGIIADVSHLSEGGFWDVARASKKPFIASHSCARSLCDHSRNLTDDQLRTVGECGGVVGVNFYSRFLVKDSDYTTAADIARHMDYIRNKAGIEAVALGSDFDGIDCALDFKDYARLPMLTDAMSERFTDDETELICGKNALRVFRDVAG
jgi:membrane dipeptidase